MKVPCDRGNCDDWLKGTSSLRHGSASSSLLGGGLENGNLISALTTCFCEGRWNLGEYDSREVCFVIFGITGRVVFSLTGGGG